MKRKIRCYLAGWFVPFREYPDWRDYLKEKLAGIMDFYDPRYDTFRGPIADFVSGDLRGVEQSDMVFYFATDSGEPGSAIECEHGRLGSKLVVLCVDKNVNAIHPFLIGIVHRVLIGMEAGEKYLALLSECGLENEFQALTAVLKNN